MKRCLSKLLLFFLFSFYFFNNSRAQNPTYPVVSMHVQTEAIANDTSNGIPDLSDSTRFQLIMNVELFDTTSIDEINVLLSDEGTSGNRLNHTFSWDVSGSSNGFSYSRNEYVVSLGLGSFNDLLNYTAAVRIKRTDNTYTDYITFSR